MSKAKQKEAFFPSLSLEEAAVQRLAEHIEAGSVKTYVDVLAFLETSKKSQELCCPVCLNAWTLPAKAKCGHVFCDRCISVWETSCRKKKIPVQCPCCRAKIEIVERTPPPPPLVAAKKKSIPTANIAQQNKKWWAMWARKARSRLKDGASWPCVFMCLVIAISFVPIHMNMKAGSVGSSTIIPDPRFLQLVETPPVMGSAVQWQAWKDLHDPKQHVLPRIHELVEMHGSAEFGLINTSMAIHPKEYVPPGSLPIRANYSVSAYYPLGTLVKLSGVPVKVGSIFKYRNALVIDPHGTSKGIKLTLPAKVVAMMAPTIVYWIGKHHLKEVIVHQKLNSSLRLILKEIRKDSNFSRFGSIPEEDEEEVQDDEEDEEQVIGPSLVFGGWRNAVPEFVPFSDSVAPVIS